MVTWVGTWKHYDIETNVHTPTHYQWTRSRFWCVFQDHQRCPHSPMMFAPYQVEGPKPPLHVLAFAIGTAVLFTWQPRYIKINWFQQGAVSTMCNTMLWCGQHCIIDGLHLFCEVVIGIEASLRHHSLDIPKDMRGWSQTTNPLIDPLVVIMDCLLCSTTVFLRMLMMA